MRISGMHAAVPQCCYLHKEFIIYIGYYYLHCSSPSGRPAMLHVSLSISSLKIAVRLPPYMLTYMFMYITDVHVHVHAFTMRDASYARE